MLQAPGHGKNKPTEENLLYQKATRPQKQGDKKNKMAD